jgi:hypothetical protein
MNRSKLQILALSAAQGLFFLGLFVGSQKTTAQEVCGLSNVQYNQMHKDGYEGQGMPAAMAPAGASVESTPPLADKRAHSQPVKPTNSELGKALGFAPKIARGVLPTVAITSPLTGATLASRSFEVRGTFTGPLNTGVSVNGAPARTFGNQWVSTPLRPPSGPFTIDVTATAYDGLTANASRNVTVGNAVPKIQLLLKQLGNIMPAKIGFGVRITGELSGSVRVDFNGDSVFDYDGPLATVPSSFYYTTAGVYTARAEATVDTVPSSSEITVVMVDVVTQRERACAVYGALRSALADNDLEESLRAFSVHQQEAMRPIFTALGDNRPVFATRLGTIANGVIGLDGANLTTLKMESGLLVGYPISIGAGSDGVWRTISL